MVQEALAAFDRTQSLSSADRDAVKNRFLIRLTRMTGLIEEPSSRDVSESLLREQRSAPAVRTLARVCGIQAKDVPILVLAFEHRLADLEDDAPYIEWTPHEGGEPTYEFALFGRSGFKRSVEEATDDRDDLRLFDLSDIVAVLDGESKTDAGRT